jgi:hypothetical protein
LADAGGDPGVDPARRRRSRYWVCIGDDDNGAGRRLGVADAAEDPVDRP